MPRGASGHLPAKGGMTLSNAFSIDLTNAVRRFKDPSEDRCLSDGDSIDCRLALVRILLDEKR
ncbi:hypothetical protein AB7M56_006360 [Bradyrhizobium elkanii]|jgi:hypothetical protein|nr:hypothetical protein [Bradyrhizobium elkanii]MCS4007564.1 hypothetical protein [Bradyrhizobium elkanii USDA 61]MCP1972343.1 hypothetical protein [Bradyrhizobium elkanii]MCS3473570.1 hypothetical protein [Bradyrhizobium elkanii]MCS3519535.1 hypothetical protein [Bradyrhizobium elkanii]